MNTMQSTASADSHEEIVRHLRTQGAVSVVTHTANQGTIGERARTRYEYVDGSVHINNGIGAGAPGLHRSALAKCRADLDDATGGDRDLQDKLFGCPLEFVQASEFVHAMKRGFRCEGS